MADLVLTRFCDSKTQGVFGRMLVDDQTIYTVERPWLGNQPRISCIPAGIYRVKDRHYNRGDYDAMEIVSVPNRTHILWHAANIHTQLAGCIAPGLSLGFYNGHWSVVSSRKAFDLLRSWFLRQIDWNTNETIELLIEWKEHDGSDGS